MNFARVAALGEGSAISPLASIRGGERIMIGKNSRIDDFVVLSAGEGGIEIGDNVHVACHVFVAGGGKVTLSDRCQISGRVSIYSSSGDLKRFGGSGSPTMPGEREKAYTAPVMVGPGAILGAGSVVMPGATIGEEAVVGAMSLVLRDSRIPPCTVYAGIPAKFLKDRA